MELFSFEAGKDWEHMEPLHVFYQFGFGVGTFSFGLGAGFVVVEEFGAGAKMSVDCFDIVASKGAAPGDVEIAVCERGCLEEVLVGVEPFKVLCQLSHADAVLEILEILGGLLNGCLHVCLRGC